MVICLERGADLHMAQLMPLPLIVSCFSKIQIGFTCLVPADLGSPGKRAVKRVYVCMYIGCWCWIVYIEPFHIQVIQPCKQPTMALLFHIYFVVYYFLIDLGFCRVSFSLHDTNVSNWLATWQERLRNGIFLY